MAPIVEFESIPAYVWTYEGNCHLSNNNIIIIKKKTVSKMLACFNTIAEL